jgi:hypothetical protein
VLIIWESSIVAFSLSALLQLYFVNIPCISIYSCTSSVPTISVLNLAIFPCYSNLLLRRWRWTGISLMRSSRLALPRLFYCGLWSLPLFCFHKCHLSLWRHYLCYNYTLFVTIGYLWTFVVCVCGINDLGHKCDEYSVLVTKPGMTLVHQNCSLKSWIPFQYTTLSAFRWSIIQLQTFGNLWVMTVSTWPVCWIKNSVQTIPFDISYNFGKIWSWPPQKLQIPKWLLTNSGFYWLPIRSHPMYG